MSSNAPSTIGNDRNLRCVLIVRFSAIGDVAMTIPAVYSACLCYPDVHFVMLTRQSMTGFFINMPANLTVVGIDLHAPEYKGPLGMKRLVARMVDTYHIDAMIDLHDVLRTKLMTMFCRLKGIRVSVINKGRSNKRALTRRYNKVMIPLTSTRARYRQAFFNAGLPLTTRFHGLYGKGAKGDPAMFAHVTPPKGDGEKWIGIAPFAAHPGKIYPLDKMEEVVRMLSRRDDCRIFVFGGGGSEMEQAQAWEQKYPAVTSLAGKKYGFPVELALLSHLDVMVSMDSANMHLAAIAGTRTVSIWGATHYYCGFKAWHQRDDDMVQLPLSCRPCSVFGDKKCFRHDLLCLNAIRPDMIYNKITEIIGGKDAKAE